MRRRPVVIVFARVPQLGAVKTRLARDVGRLEAWRFHRIATAATLRRLAGASRWRLILALTPDRLGQRARVAPVAVERMTQGRGDLGRRMARALRRQQPAPVVLVGSDIPALNADEVRRAFRCLAAADVVFGPATDGGYWLVGSRGRRSPERWFRKVRWSGPDALADSLANLERNLRVARAGRLSDVDTGVDLARLPAENRAALTRPPALRAPVASASARRSYKACGGYRAGLSGSGPKRRGRPPASPAPRIDRCRWRLRRWRATGSSKYR